MEENMSQSGIDFRDEKKVIYQEREKKKVMY